jgi:mRNA-degrading endonuclease RelE of RelBE toxin-antitoxin system
MKRSLIDLGSYRVGDFRVLCNLQDDVLTGLVLQTGNHREIYR